MPVNIDVGAKKKLKPTAYGQDVSESTSTTKQEGLTSGVLDAELLNQILSGLSRQMTNKEIEAYADSLLRPQLNAGLEAARHNLEATKLGLEQEKDTLAAQLAREIMEQNNAYAKSAADVQTAALARGMGRSSYTMQTLAGQGNALAEAVRQLTSENTRQTAQLQDRITQAEQQAAQTENRLNADFAANLAAKIQEIRQNQQASRDSAYMTAVSASMGTKSASTGTTTGSESSMNVTGKVTDSNGKKNNTGAKTSRGSTSGGYDHL